MALLLIFAAAFLTACAIALPPAPTITHVVLIWMTHPNRTEDRRELENAAHSLQRLPGVVRVETTRSLPRRGGRIPQGYDLAVLITFRDRMALRLYEGDPRRFEAMHRYLRPLVERYEVRNFSDR
jgi:hypothetical protein